MTRAPAQTPQSAAHRPTAAPAVAAVVLTVVLVFTQSPVALLIWAYDGLIAALILLGVTLAGVPILHCFKLHDLPARWRWLYSAGLGLGLASLLMLACGLLGWIGLAHRWIAPGILALFAAIGAVLCAAELARRQVRERVQPPRATNTSAWWWVALAPFAALLMLVAVCPPGVLWQEEGNGYDVLEYHLQLPREYFDAGRITYLPHNVYASFPANAEMLDLLAMQVCGRTIDAWGIAQCLNALVAVLFVAAAWASGRDHSTQSGWVAAVAAGSCGWLIYLSGLAYVENGMLFAGLLATCALSKTLGTSAVLHPYRWIALSGVLAGLSCGFKYPAVALVAVPLSVAIIASSWTAKRKLAGFATFTAFGALAFSPWLAKNTVYTHNPVFPLLSEHFAHQPDGWGVEEARHFADVHRPAPQEATIIARLRAGVHHLVTERDQRFGALVLVLAAVGAVRSPCPLRRAWLTVLAVQLLAWLTLTHLFARFAVVLLIPMVLCAAYAIKEIPTKPGWRFATVAGMLLSLFFTTRLYAEHLYTRAGQKLPLEGATQIFTDGALDAYAYLGTINRELPANAKVLLVGDARPFYVERPVVYCVVFNRNPLAELAERSAAPQEVIAWMRTQDITHVLVHWTEMARLRHSRYGFPPALDRSFFEGLSSAGLRVLREYPAPNGGPSPMATLYAIANLDSQQP